MFSFEPEPADHHQLLMRKLEAVERGEIPRLMVFMPPGSAKSHYANVMFSAWYAGKNPGKKLITASYSGEVADKWGRRVRSIVTTPDYERIFDTKLSKQSQAAGRWELNSRSEYYAVGVGGSVTSYRGDLGIIDDPVKGRADADSETVRKTIIEWYKSDFWTRLKPHAAQVIILTRWHEEDLAGWLLESGFAGEWEVLSIPMEAEAQDDPLGRKIGERLWKEWFTDEMVQTAKRDPRLWASLFQQRPAPEDGAFFKKEWMRYYDVAPDNLRIYMASDYAVTSKGGDYTVHGIMGVDSDGNLFVLDWWRGQEDSLIWAQSAIDMVKRWKPLQWGDEGGVIDKSMAPLLQKMQVEQEAWCARESYPARNDKETRAQAIRGRMAAGKVFFPRNASWLADFINELLLFPNGKHDDQVDVLGLFGRMLFYMQSAQKPPQPKQTQIDLRMPTLGELTAEHDREYEQAEKRDRFL